MAPAPALGIGILALACCAAVSNHILVSRLNRKIEDLIDALIGGEDLPPPPHKRPYMRWGVTGLVVLVFVLVLASELSVSTVRDFWETHPMVSALGSGVLLILLTTLTIEQLREKGRSRTREKPALLALNSYLLATDQSTRAITQAIDDRVAQLAPDLQTPKKLSRVDELTIIFEADPKWFHGLSRLAEDQVRSTTPGLLQATDALSQYPPLTYAIDELDAAQDELMTFGLYARAIARDGTEVSLWPPKTPKVKDLSDILRQRYDRYAQLFINESAISRSARKKRLPKLRLYWREKRKAGDLMSGIAKTLEAKTPSRHAAKRIW